MRGAIGQTLAAIACSLISRSAASPKAKPRAGIAESFHYIAGALWQAEIVFSRDWRCVIQALNRLTAGSAGQKLLVAAQSADLPASLAAPANSCPGQLYLALLPHPDDWDSDDAKSETWRMDGGEWQALD